MSLLFLSLGHDHHGLSFKSRNHRPHTRSTGGMGSGLTLFSDPHVFNSSQRALSPQSCPFVSQEWTHSGCSGNSGLESELKVLPLQTKGTCPSGLQDQGALVRKSLLLPLPEKEARFLCPKVRVKKKPCGIRGLGVQRRSVGWAQD